MKLPKYPNEYYRLQIRSTASRAIADDIAAYSSKKNIAKAEVARLAFSQFFSKELGRTIAYP